jgi:lipoprotein-anchoring transpeptidase ErfK/SrfK
VKSVPVVVLVAAALVAVPAPASAGKPGKFCRGGVLHPVGTATAAFAAVVRGKTTTYARPHGKVLARFGKVNDNGYPTTFSVVGAVLTRSCAASWYRVKLPIRPNGVVGYVRPSDVLVQKVTTRIEVDISARQLSLYIGRKLAIKTAVAVGSDATPTPTGRFYVNQRLLAKDPNGAYGPMALGVSAFSDVLTGWTQGGPIGIHGTNAPWSIGRAVSNGCIRVPNDTIRKLFAAAYGGTPVVIHA